MSFFSRLRKPWLGVDVSRDYAHLDDFENIRDLVMFKVERSRFSKRIIFVAASGFFTGSYSIFSTNVVGPALAYVYWKDSCNGKHGLGINVATLLGSCVGMVLFGYPADQFGRKRLYGVELAIVISATLGLTQASAGYNNKVMNIYPRILFWRTLLGIGVGAEYPLSALIASEWVSTKNRGRMLAAVFLAQPLAQLVAQSVGLGALRGISAYKNLNPSEMEHSEAAAVIDAVWRLTIGVGAASALLAIIGRLTIPETPRYLLEKERDAPAALVSITDVYPTHRSKANKSTSSVADDTTEYDNNRGESSVGQELQAQGNIGSGVVGDSGEHTVHQNSQARVGTTAQLSDYSDKGNAPHAVKTFRQRVKATWGKLKVFMSSKFGPILLATSFCWFILDICVYGLGLDSPQLISKIWLAGKPSASKRGKCSSSDWDSSFSNAPIYHVMEGNINRALKTTAPASIVGCLLILLLVNRVPRVRFMICMFISLSVIFVITGANLFTVYETPDHDVTVVFYAISLFLLNLGPNTITFMLPAELFPTKWRGTCYGLAAASGKLGAIVIQLVFWKVRAGGTQKEPLGILLLVFAPLMLLAAIVAWLWIPEVQEPVIHQSNGVREYSMFVNRSLEDITEDPTQGQAIGLRRKFKHFFSSWLSLS